MSGHTIVLISPPWRLPWESSLALATLGPILRDAGHQVHEVHGMARYPKTDGDGFMMMSFGAHFFTPLLRPDVDARQVADNVCADLKRQMSLDGVVASPLATLQDLGIAEDRVRALVHREVEHAGTCVKRCVADTLAFEPAVVGLSVTFETQLPAALAIAEGLAVVRPDLPIALRGAACAGLVADALLEAFACIAAVCWGDREAAITALTEGLADGRDVTDIPNVSARDAAGTVRRSSSSGRDH